MSAVIAADHSDLRARAVSRAQEYASTFECDGSVLVAITHAPAACRRRGVLIVVGGPQYRVGSHRQFTLLARQLGAHGIASMRFDYRGMGDSAGEARMFEQIGPDIKAAVDHFMTQAPEIEEVVLWGLCDAASAALFYAYRDKRVTGLVLLNPWVRTAAGEAKAYLRHYYLRRLLDRRFWAKVAQGRLAFWQSLRGLWTNVRVARSKGESSCAAPPQPHEAHPLPERMLDGLQRFRGRILLVLSGNDLTAKEFVDLAASSRAWRKALASGRVTRVDLPDANHTFSTRAWRDRVATSTAQWVMSC